MTATALHARSPEPASSRAARVGSRRFERLLHGISGGFGVLYALQTLDAFFADRASLAGPLGTAVEVLVVASVAAGVLGAVLRVQGRRAFAVSFGLFALALAAWPASMAAPVPADPMPWLVALAPVGLVSLVVACEGSVVPLVVSVAMGAQVTTALLLFARFSVVDAVSNGAFVVTVASLLVLLLGAVRRGITKADDAQHAALDRYESDREDAALEAERIKTDAFVHDSVLMTLLGAAGARDSAAEALVARMAGNALTTLADVEMAAGAGRRVPFGEVLARADPELLALSTRIGLSTDRVDALVLPEHIAEAMVEATLEAIANSMRHAGPGASRRATIETFGIDGIRVLVEDDGCGFDLDAIPPDRRGVRDCLLGRVHGVAGRVRIDSAPGRGTRVEISYGAFFNAEVESHRPEVLA